MRHVRDPRLPRLYVRRRLSHIRIAIPAAPTALPELGYLSHRLEACPSDVVHHVVALSVSLDLD